VGNAKLRKYLIIAPLCGGAFISYKLNTNVYKIFQLKLKIIFFNILTGGRILEFTMY
jgi:hypothetical protein